MTALAGGTASGLATELADPPGHRHPRRCVRRLDEAENDDQLARLVRTCFRQTEQVRELAAKYVQAAAAPDGSGDIASLTWRIHARESDLPRRRRRRRDRRLSNRGRIILVIVLVGLFILATSLRGIAGVYTDYLWFDSLGLESVWRGIVGARLALGLIFTAAFFVFLFINLTIADRLAPNFRPQGPEEELLERYHEFVNRRSRLLRAAVALLFALIAGAGVSSQWNEWILFTHRQDFGVEDPQFHTDIGFYVFQLPFLSYVVSWLFAAFVIILIVTAVAHYLNEGIRVQVPGERVTPQVKAHLSVLLGILALIKAGDYWLQRYELTFSAQGAVDGATYTDINAQLPAIYLLLLISLLSFVLFIINIWRRGWVLPVLAVGLWGFVAIVAGGIYPRSCSGSAWSRQESAGSRPTSGATSRRPEPAMGLDDVEVRPFDYNEELTAQGPRGQRAHRAEHPIARPAVVATPTSACRRGGLLRVRRPGCRPLSDQRPDDPGHHLKPRAGPFRHPPVVLGRPARGVHPRVRTGSRPGRAVTSSGRPNFIVGSVPVENELGLPLDQPQIYVGEGLGGYSIVGATRSEVDYLDENGDTVSFEYDGTGGVDAEVVPPAGGLRPPLRRLGPRCLQLHRRRLADHVHPRHP